MKTNSMAYEIRDYGKKPAFASFLPGISGIRGIPVWCYYVNRGQCMVSFGAENKDKAIMEFFPAHEAYQTAKRTGFRTFLRVNGQFLEPFAQEEKPHRMIIYKNSLELEQEDARNGIRTEVSYFTLPEEQLGALVRAVTVTNMRDKGDPEGRLELELLDGMPALIPYGISIEASKMTKELAKAWMESELLEGEITCYRVRASMGDTAVVRALEGANFSVGVLADGTRLTAVADPEAVFGYDNSLGVPVIFVQNGIEGVEKYPKLRQNRVPCSFYCLKRALAPGESVTLYEILGQTERLRELELFGKKCFDRSYFEAKRQRADRLAEELGEYMDCCTADPVFDEYCRYTFMDNVLRGGFPVLLGEDKVFYVYSRKHGDLERDYNYFSMLPEFYSQGNGNFRDVNQNRRSDIFFAPFVGDFNIRTFFSLLQPDGYNPLGIEQMTYELGTKTFTPGSLYRELLADTGLTEAQREVAFSQQLSAATPLVNGKFREGYWTDHWTYNLDLIESYLRIFPEQEEPLLFEERCTWFRPQAGILERRKRCEVTEQGLRQYHYLTENLPAAPGCENELLLCGDYGKGSVVRASVMEKLLMLCLTKFAALDAYGMGIEMEGGKPGWYDALNGLPGLFGSSVCELCELSRIMEYTIAALEKYGRDVDVLRELAQLYRVLRRIAAQERTNLLSPGESVSFWNQANDAKEAFRKKIYRGVSGKKETLRAKWLIGALREWQELVNAGIQKATDVGGGICPAYFFYEVTDWEKNETGILPLHFAQRELPLFLEGAVRWLKLSADIRTKRELYGQVKKSELYDRKLSMYKVNAPLDGSSYELGRCRAFTPGWLENESIWLHMEYKYLLELLKSGLYPEFFADLHRVGIPFLDPEAYGRSVFENSSFLASSANPDSRIHGRGFVARLSGSTAEFIQMWTLMMFGAAPFETDPDSGILKLALQPALPKWLIPSDGQVTARFLGTTVIRYHFREQADYYPGSYEVSKMLLHYKETADTPGTEACEIAGGIISGSDALAVREGRVREIEVYIGMKK